ncbi:PP2C family protein-serine/threonine phosphatase [Streptomyces sp. NPDC021093]|uniref:PP2C family protein-serine/threonine phosphatase n=1 Tax=Streptomyces sp. NPDC021093 TaxID=3365112 RepID=UPI00379B74DE
MVRKLTAFPVPWPPLLLLVACVALDAATPLDQRFDWLLAAVPALAAASCTVGATLGFGAAAIAVEVVLALVNDRLGSYLVLPLVAILAVTLAAAYASRVRLLREESLENTRSVAHTIQGIVLRPLPPAIGPMTLFVHYEAVASEARVGGDFYEALNTAHGVRVILGDVQGKGLPAVENAAVLLASFREAAYDAPDLAALAARLETSMLRHSERHPESETAERFATVVLAEFPEESPVVRIVNCGHPEPLWQRGEITRFLEPDERLPPVALASLLDGPYRWKEYPFAVGDRLVLYTDGVSEARDAAGVFYPLAARAPKWASLAAGDALDRLAADLGEYRNKGADDVAVLLIERTAGPPVKAPAQDPVQDPVQE